ncbi:MAG: hypothetical protein IKI16_01350 [Prevotella sp.]|nr:hypothetical protein [Prevotella sp.]
MFIIADDITGAAEMAGIAFRFGLRAHLQLCSPSNTQQLLPPPSTGRERGWVSILATDTRGMSEDEAVAETRHIATNLLIASPSRGRLEGWGGEIASPSRGRLEGAFKKTDSALRGHVVAELTTLMETIGYQRAVYMPANPSKDRIIKDGVYLIKGVPIHETAFSYDPEFPAKTSVLRERFPDAENHHIIMPDAETLDDICHIVETYNDGHTLFAGAADLFEAWLKKRPTPLPLPEWRGADRCENSLPLRGEVGGGLLLLCGSTQSKPLDLGIPEYPMPRVVYDGEAPVTSWIEEIKEAPAGAILSFGTNTHRTGKEAAVYLRNAMAEAATAFINTHHPQEIVIEGGATAFCLLNRLGWHHFRITNEIAPGVVRMQLTSLNPQPSTINRQPSTVNRQPSTVNPQPSTFITLKPGSYPWGDLWKKL